jgi:hypothetical protein
MLVSGSGQRELVENQVRLARRHVVRNDPGKKLIMEHFAVRASEIVPQIHPHGRGRVP